MLEDMQAEALQLVALGHSYRTAARMMSREAGTELGPDGVTALPARSVSHMWVKRAVDRTLADLATKTSAAVEVMRQREMAKCDVMEAAIADRVTVGDDDAIRTRLLIMARRAKYVPGVEAPLQIEADLSVSLPPAVADRLSQARERVAARERLMLEAGGAVDADVVEGEVI